MDSTTLDIIQCIAIVIVGWLMYKAGKKDGFYIGTVATIDYLSKRGFIEVEEAPAEQP